MGYQLIGDLVQCTHQGEELLKYGTKFQYIHDGGLPTIEKEYEYIRAVNLIWKHKIDGWWHYKRDMIRHNICTEEEFDIAME